MKANRTVQDITYLCTKLGGYVRQMHTLLAEFPAQKFLPFNQLESTDVFRLWTRLNEKLHGKRFLLHNYKNTNWFNEFDSKVGQIPYGLAVRIPGFHPGGPGSTPGMGTAVSFCVSFFLL